MSPTRCRTALLRAVPYNYRDSYTDLGNCVFLSTIDSDPLPARRIFPRNLMLTQFPSQSSENWDIFLISKAGLLFTPSPFIPTRSVFVGGSRFIME